ncbi:MAG TPA: O-antigen ligase family protein [Mycobacteriales bacterium]|nr:O-antigen ligase family protein [Mycobacteriales bacterium]
MTLVLVGVVAIVAVIIATRLDFKGTAFGLAMLAAFTLPWNGIRPAHVQPGDILLFLAIVLYLAGGLKQRLPQLPLWITQLGVVIVVVTVAHELIPVDAHYLAARTVLTADGKSFYDFQSNLVNGAKFAFGIFGLPLIFGFAASQRRNALHLLGMAFAAGVSLSALIAFLDGQGLTHIGASLTHVQFLQTREGGLSYHPNFLSAGCVIAFPIAIWRMMTGSRRERWFGGAMAFAIVLGTYATGSRGGAACIVLGGVLSALLVPQVRRHIVPIGFATMLLAIVAFVAVPGFGHAVLKGTRLVGGQNTTGSNTVRHLVAQQGIRDFEYSPIYGLGFQTAADAQNVYLQELQSGGLILLISMTVFTLGGVRAAYIMRDEDSLAAPLAVSMVAAAVLNYFEADLTDRFFYVPAGIVAAMVAVRALRREQAPDSPAQPSLASPTNARVLVG